jgi:hypothetical protein
MLVSLHEVKFISLKSFLRYVVCKIKARVKEKIHKSYVADCLQAIATNTAKMGGGTVIEKSYRDIIAKIEDLDTSKGKSKLKQGKTAEEIIFSVMAKSGLKLDRNLERGKT